MENRREMDRAIDIAIERTLGAQTDVQEMLQPDAAPDPSLVDRVVHRAEDLHVLADEAAVETEMHSGHRRSSTA